MIAISENAVLILMLLFMLRIIRQEIRFWIGYNAYVLIKLGVLLKLIGTWLRKLIKFDEVKRTDLKSKRKGSKKK